ncbi:uncharacterized protein TNCV_449281 [Trichonephila clavipes]|nr:uncharacterized protein TNCV_449281 [Trichonephila clavipes]
MWLVEGEREVGSTLTIPRGALVQNCDGTEPNRSATCMVLKAMDNGRSTITPYHYEFRGLRSNVTVDRAFGGSQAFDFPTPRALPFPPRCKGAVGSLGVRAPDPGPESLGSMPVLPNTLRVRTEYVLIKSVGPKVLWAESQVQRTGENFPPLQFHA